MLVAIATLFVGCSKDDDNKAVDKNGNCTSATIDAYNDIGNKAYRLYYSSSRSDIEAIQLSCNNFKSLIGGKSCTALDLTTGSEKSINSGSRDTVCNEANRLMANFNQSQSQTSPSTPSYTSYNCTQAQINAYNDVLYKTITLSDYSSTTDQLNDAHAACMKYKSLFSNSCKASLPMNGSESWIDSKSLDTNCNKVSEIAASRAAAILKDRNLVVAKLTGKIKMTVIDASKIKATDVSIYAYQNGNTFEYGLNGTWDKNRSYCVLVSTQAILKNNEVAFQFNKFSISQALDLVKISKDISDENFSEITCYGSTWQNAKDLTVGDLQDAFNNILKIEVIK